MPACQNPVFGPSSLNPIVFHSTTDMATNTDKVMKTENMKDFKGRKSFSASPQTFLKSKTLDSGNHFQVNAPPINSKSSSSLSNSLNHRESTPPHLLKTLPEDPSTPVASQPLGLYGEDNTLALSGASNIHNSNTTIPNSNSFSSSSSSSSSVSHSLAAKNKGPKAFGQRGHSLTSSVSDITMAEQDPVVIDEDSDCLMNDSSNIGTSKNRPPSLNPLLNSNLGSSANPPFAGSMPSTPSSAFFHTSQEPTSSTMAALASTSTKDGRSLRPSDLPNSSGTSVLSDNSFPLPVHKVLDAITPHISHYSDDDKVTLLKGILSLTTRPVLSAIQEHISPLLKKDPFAYLPNEISLRIISFIDDPKTLARASQVSRLWYLILSDDLTWKELCKTHHYRRLSAAVTVTPKLFQSSNNGSSSDSKAIDINTFRSSAIHGPNPETNNAIATGMNDFVESQYYPEAMRHPAPTNYRSHFKHQYMLNTAWQSGGRLAAKYVINHAGVVTSLIMTSKYIAFSLDSSKIFVFSEDGKLLRSLFGHTMGVWALSISGDTLVSGGCDRDVRVWNLKTGECLQILRGHQSTIRCLQMVDEKTVISGSRDTSVRVWDIENGRCLHVLNGHTSTVRCIEAKGDICVSGSYDCTAKVWRISDGTLLHTFYGHLSQIYSLAFDGERLVTGSLDAVIKVWDVKAGTDLATLAGHTSLVSLLQLKGDTLASGGSDGTVRLWNLKSFECIHRFAAHDNSVTTLQFDDYRLVSGSSDGRVKVWDRATGLLIRELSSPYNSVWRIEFKDEKLAILASRNQQVHFKLISFCPQKDSFDKKMQEMDKKRMDSLIDDSVALPTSDGASNALGLSGINTSIDESIILGSSSSGSSSSGQTGGESSRRLDPTSGSTANPSSSAIPTFSSSIFATMPGPVPSNNVSETNSRNNSRRSSFSSINPMMSLVGGTLPVLQSSRQESSSNNNNDTISNTNSSTQSTSADGTNPSLLELTIDLTNRGSTGNVNGGLNSPISIPSFAPRLTSALNAASQISTNPNLGDGWTLGSISGSRPASRSTSRSFFSSRANDDNQLFSSLEHHQDGAATPTPSTTVHANAGNTPLPTSHPDSNEDGPTASTHALPTSNSTVSTPVRNITSTPTNPPPHNTGNYSSRRNVSSSSFQHTD